MLAFTDEFVTQGYNKRVIYFPIIHKEQNYNSLAYFPPTTFKYRCLLFGFNELYQPSTSAQ